MLKKQVSASALVLAVAVAAVTAAPAHAQATKYFSQDVEMVITVNLRQMLESKLAKDNKNLVESLQAMVRSKIQENEEAKAFFAATDFDLFRDLDSVTFAGQASKDAKKAVIVINGRFNTKKLGDSLAGLAKVKKDELKIHEAGGATIYEFTPAGKDRSFMALADKNTLIATQTMDGLKAALERGKAGKREASKQLAALLDKTNKNQSITIVATKSALDRSIKESDNAQLQAANQLAKDVEGMVGNITLDKEIVFGVEVKAKNAESAKQMAKLTQQMLKMADGMFRQQAQENPQAALLVDIVATLRAESAGTSMNVQGRVPRETIDQVTKLIENFLP